MNVTYYSLGNADADGAVSPTLSTGYDGKKAEEHERPVTVYYFFVKRHLVPNTGSVKKHSLSSPITCTAGGLALGLHSVCLT